MPQVNYQPVKLCPNCSHIVAHSSLNLHGIVGILGDLSFIELYRTSILSVFWRQYYNATQYGYLEVVECAKGLESVGLTKQSTGCLK